MIGLFARPQVVTKRRLTARARRRLQDEIRARLPKSMRQPLIAEGRDDRRLCLEAGRDAARALDRDLPPGFEDDPVLGLEQWFRQFVTAESIRLELEQMTPGRELRAPSLPASQPPSSWILPQAPRLGRGFLLTCDSDGCLRLLRCRAEEPPSRTPLSRWRRWGPVAAAIAFGLLAGLVIGLRLVALGRIG